MRPVALDLDCPPASPPRPKRADWPGVSPFRIPSTRARLGYELLSNLKLDVSSTSAPNLATARNPRLPVGRLFVGKFGCLSRVGS
jgi:hypothetical protein